MAYSLALPPNELRIGPKMSAIPPWLHLPEITTLSGHPYQRVDEQLNPWSFASGQYLQNPAQPSARP